MQVPGDQWPIFIYAGCEYDPEDPWKGAFRGAILVAVSGIQWVLYVSEQCSEYTKTF